MSTTKKLNQGLVKLTKENISEGRLGKKIKSISGSDKVLTKNELITLCGYGISIPASSSAGFSLRIKSV